MPSAHSQRPRVANSTRKPQTSHLSAEHSLRRQEKPERLTSLLREHRQLLNKIKQKKRELQKLSERLQTTLNETIRSMQPVLAEIEQLDREIHALFAELLARKWQPRGSVLAIKRVYRILQELEVLSPRGAGDPARGFDREEKDSSEPGAGAGGQQEFPSSADDGGASARRPDAGAAGQSLRGLFHRLAAAMHPDKVQHEEEKARRTEAMKEITRAYQEGDMARLIELEQTWLRGGEIVAENDELDQRCAALSRTNAALRAQLDEVKDELKDLRRSPQAEVLANILRMARHKGQDPRTAAVEETQAHLAQLREMLPFVQSFRDGKIDLETLIAGPPSVRGPKPPDDFADAFELDDLLDGLFDDSSNKRSQHRKKRREAIRAKRPDDSPF